MLIVGDKLKELIIKYDISPIQCYDGTCIKLGLGHIIKKYLYDSADHIVEYGRSMPVQSIINENIARNGLVLKPQTAVLGMSEEKITIPKGYFGLLQTKGSLARLMISLHFADGQVDPGFTGHITFEIFNASNLTVLIGHRKPVGNLYIFKTDGVYEGYHGRYNNALEPTSFIDEA